MVLVNYKLARDVHWLVICPLTWIDRKDVTQLTITPIFSTSDSHGIKLWFGAVFSSVNSLVLFARFFFSFPLLLLPWTIPCMIVLTRPFVFVMWPYHFRFFLDCSKEVTMTTNLLIDSVPNFLVCYVVFIGSFEESLEAFHFHYHDHFIVCREGSRLSCIQHNW